MPGIVEKSRRNAIYLAKRLTWKPRNAREEAIVDRLGRHDISPVSLNHYLDNEDVPFEVGRFPRMLSDYYGLPDVISNSIDRFRRESLSLPEDSQEARKKLRNLMSTDVANYLSTNPLASIRIFKANGFCVEQK